MRARWNIAWRNRTWVAWRVTTMHVLSLRMVVGANPERVGINSARIARGLLEAKLPMIAVDATPPPL